MSSRLLEILGRALSVDTADLIWAWLDTIKNKRPQSASGQSLYQITQLFQKNKPEAAENQLKAYLADNPDCPLGRMAAAALCISKGQIDAAIKELNSVYTHQPGNTMALYALGNCYERKLCEDQAAAFYQDCLKFKSFLQLPRYRLAAIYLKNCQLEKTLQEYEALRKEYPDDITVLSAIGNLHCALGQFHDAINAFNTAIIIHPDNFNGIEDDIEQLISDGKLEDASKKIEDLLIQFPERADLLVRYADVLALLGLENESIGQYEQALQIRPDCLEATIKLGTAYLQNNDYQTSARYFNRAFEINDNIVDAYIGLALAYNLSHNNAEAIETLSLAAAIEPNSSLLFTQTAALHLKNLLNLNNDQLDSDTLDNYNFFEKVINTHNDQLQLNPYNPDLLYRFGILLMHAGKKESAINAFRTALDINPTFYRARNKLVICLIDSGDNDSALEVLAAPNCLDKDILALHYKTALLYCDKFRFACTLLNLENHLIDNFADSNACQNISIVLQNLGLLDRASFMWENLEDTAKQALKML
jgi:tetratricopeptide (TPR) repeat protein